MLLAPAAHAQPPRISTVFPPVVQRGAASTVTLTGKDLKPGSRVLVSGKGVTATAAKGGGESLAVRLQVALDAAPGVRELRLIGPNGASNAARVAVGRFPVRAEKEPNSRLEAAERLATAPVTLYGRIDPTGDEDMFRFRAGAGETWVFEVGTVSHGSPLDGFLHLQDGLGRDLGTVLQTRDREPRLVHTFKASGEYVVSVRDTAFRGRPEATYRLTVGPLPAVTRGAATRRGARVK